MGLLEKAGKIQADGPKATPKKKPVRAAKPKKAKKEKTNKQVKDKKDKREKKDKASRSSIYTKLLAMILCKTVLL